ncbi:hypothetical protein [Xanthomonas phage Suba]|uniref:Uncharacterized protein n=1 Tax=Xanthomonas phage Suba TaxID=2674975 RepID=A0A679KD60_9CAUD|nr:hypothetical protein QAY88_gp37 [Xanthomonas phage Suba]CAA2409834.1 hypothetical protein [Xanthomonas phage Suba]
MQSFKFRLSKIARTVSTMDLRKTAEQQRAEEIATKARRFESRNKTAGKRSSFPVSTEWELV